MDKVSKILLVLAALVVGGILTARLMFPSNAISIIGTSGNAGQEQGVGIPVDEDSNGGISFNHPVTEEELNALMATYDFDTEFYPYFRTLSDEQKKAYYFIYDCVIKGEEEVFFGKTVRVDKNEIMDVVNAVYLDNPGMFWMETGARYSYNRKNGMTSSVIPEYNDYVNDLDNNRDEFESQVQAIVREAKAYESQGIVYMEALVHDHLCERCVYDLDAHNHQSAFSCLVEGSSVCGGYARAFQYVMQQLGVPAYYVMGQAIVSEGGPHAWVIVMIGGNAYNVDVTWDDDLGRQMGESVHAFFNVTDAQIARTHQRDEVSECLPRCTMEDLSYDKVIGDTITADEISWQ